MTPKIKTAVIPVAGRGTRIMPLTLHQPKGMVNIVDRPLVHYVIDEVIAAGITRIIMVTSPEQTEFQLYVEYLLKKDPEWQKKHLTFEFAVQEKPLGDGDALWSARRLIKDEPFLVCFSDDLLIDKRPPLKTLTDFYEKTGAPIVVLEPVPKTKVSSYGVVKAKTDKNYKPLYKIEDVVEKPTIEDAPSNLTVIGRYVVTPKLYSLLEKQYPYQGKEIKLAGALKLYAQSGQPLYGWEFPGLRFDAGSKIGILKAQAYFGTYHQELGPEFKKFLKKLQ